MRLHHRRAAQQRLCVRGDSAALAPAPPLPLPRSLPPLPSLLSARAPHPSTALGWLPPSLPAGGTRVGPWLLIAAGRAELPARGLARRAPVERRGAGRGAGRRGAGRRRRTAPMAEQRVSRWYFGGIASCGAACCTHPLDLLKVRARRRRGGAAAGGGGGARGAEDGGDRREEPRSGAAGGPRGRPGRAVSGWRRRRPRCWPRAHWAARPRPRCQPSAGRLASPPPLKGAARGGGCQP